MISVIKPHGAPGVLRKRGLLATRRLIEAYDKNPADYQSGDRTFTFSRDIYGHRSVVEALRRAQHNKCCYCERKAEGDIEHFRPKSGYQQSIGSPFQRPGYYWLAYQWSNLLFACGPCNQRHKKSIFPLLRAGRRAKSHHNELAREEPLLLDPSTDDPMEHIDFRDEVAYAIEGSRRGEATIRVLQLNREDLIESRRDRLQLLLLLKERIRQIEKEIRRRTIQGLTSPSPLIRQLAKIRDVLLSATSDGAEYASMSRAAMSD